MGDRVMVSEWRDGHNRKMRLPKHHYEQWLRDYHAKVAAARQDEMCRVLLEEHCPLIAPLRVIVHGYVEPTTIATKLFMTEKTTIQEGKVSSAAPLRRSVRLSKGIK